MITRKTIPYNYSAVSSFLNCRFHPKREAYTCILFPQYTLGTELLTFKLTGVVFKIAVQMSWLRANFDNPVITKDAHSSLLFNCNTLFTWCHIVIFQKLPFKPTLTKLVVMLRPVHVAQFF